MGASLKISVQLGLVIRFQWTVNVVKPTTLASAALSSATNYHARCDLRRNQRPPIYINGTLVAGPWQHRSQTSATSGLTHWQQFFSNSNRRFDRHDHICCWGAALTQADVTKLYNSGNGLNSAQALAAGLSVAPTNGYDFDANNPLQLGLDSIGSNQLTPVNGPTITAGVVSPPTIGNNGYQATGANRYQYLTNQIGGKAALQSLGTTSSLL